MTSTIMMVTYNRLFLTQKTFEGLFGSTDYPYNLIIVDNGSTDGSIEYLKELNISDPNCKDFTYHQNATNLGIAIGRNMCLKLADKYQDPWLCCMDNDVLMPNGWLRESIDIMKHNDKLSIGVNMEDVSYSIVKRNNKEFQLKSQGNLGSANMTFPRKLHSAIGYFKYYGLYGTEDANWAARSRVAGWEIGYIKENGTHLGVGDLDQGEYREFKTQCHAKNLQPFIEDCREYFSGRKSIYINFDFDKLTEPTINKSI